MALNIPLPRIVADAQPGGQYLMAARAQNAFAREQAQLHKQNMMNQILQTQAAAEPTTMQQKIDRGMAQNRLLDLRAQYYGPQQDAQLAQRQAALQQMQTMTPLNAQKAQLAAQLQQFQLNSLNPLKQQQLKQQVEGFPAMQAAKMAQMKKMAVGRGVGARERMELQQQLQTDNPQWDAQNANQAEGPYSLNKKKFPDGTPPPKLSGFLRNN